MKTILFLALAAVALAISIEGKAGYAISQEILFRQWMRQNGKAYEGDEYKKRFNIFAANKAMIDNHNANRKHDDEMTMGLNEFADLTSEEFTAYRMKPRDFSKVERKRVEILNNTDVTYSVDWRKKGAVTGIKNQGQCGSCWSFSSTGSMEGIHHIHGYTLTGMSEKNLMDCSWAEGNMGCDGGLMDDAFQYVIKTGGIDSEAAYPYSPVSSHSCQFTTGKEVSNSKITSYSDVQSGSESQLAQYAMIQPVSVAIDASHMSFQFYSGGVYYEPECSSTQLDHGVLVVGYGVDNGQDFWLVKNSWGTSWGLQGYIMMSKDRNNNCGIATAASVPKI